jgi:hypothetical protein
MPSLDVGAGLRGKEGKKMKKSLFLVAAVALLAASAHAGEIKIHEWPCVFIKQEIPGLEIPVTMDVGYWVHIKDQDKIKIKLSQVSIHEYEGCTDMVVETNFNLSMSCTISPTGAVGGKYSCSVSPADIDAPGGTTTVCAKLKEANLGDQAGGKKNVKVATIKIWVVPR